MAALRARHRISRWGATDEEATRSLAGDEAVPDPGIASTRAIDIHAPAHAVWPWLAVPPHRHRRRAHPPRRAVPDDPHHEPRHGCREAPSDPAIDVVGSGSWRLRDGSPTDARHQKARRTRLVPACIATYRPAGRAARNARRSVDAGKGAYLFLYPSPADRAWLSGGGPRSPRVTRYGS